MADLSHVQAVYKRYVEARNALLDELHLSRRSNRDPLSEFSEWLVAQLVDGTLAASPVQPGWDIQTQVGERIQVKYLANSADTWVNEHEIRVNNLMNSYALVIFEALLPKAVILFPVERLAEIGSALVKRHGNLATNLQFTRANYCAILNDPERFEKLGVRLYLAPDWHRP